MNCWKTNLLVIFLGGLAIGQPAIAQPDVNTAKPPVARRAPRTTMIHGDTLVDNYYWLREKSSKEVVAYLEAENAYTAAIMKATDGVQAALYLEMVGRI